MCVIWNTDIGHVLKYSTLLPEGTCRPWDSSFKLSVYIYMYNICIYIIHIYIYIIYIYICICSHKSDKVTDLGNIFQRSCSRRGSLRKETAPHTTNVHVRMSYITVSTSAYASK